jgi:hypothetical protein
METLVGLIFVDDVFSLETLSPSSEGLWPWLGCIRPSFDLIGDFEVIGRFFFEDNHLGDHEGIFFFSLRNHLQLGSLQSRLLIILFVVHRSFEGRHAFAGLSQHTLEFFNLFFPGSEDDLVVGLDSPEKIIVHCELFFPTDLLFLQLEREFNLFDCERNAVDQGAVFCE